MKYITQKFDVIGFVADKLNVPVEDIQGNIRTKKTAFARRLAAKLATMYMVMLYDVPYPYYVFLEYFPNHRNHTSVLSMIRVFDEEYAIYSNMRKEVQPIIDEFISLTTQLHGIEQHKTQNNG